MSFNPLDSDLDHNTPNNMGSSDDDYDSDEKNAQQEANSGSKLSSIFTVLGEVLLTLAVLAACYIVWQLWWTGVMSEQEQNRQAQSVSWANPGTDANGVKIAAPQPGDPPVEPTPPLSDGQVIGQIYIPRFGAQWKRLIVEGIGLEQLARHGLGHYPTTQLPGQLGNFAAAGHRAGFGEALGNVPALRANDALVVRTQNYWYVYHYTNYEIVAPNDSAVLAPVPEEPGKQPIKRFITLTTCEPQYTTPTHRWISYGEFDYWAKVSDGVPKELATTGDNGQVKFTQATPDWTSYIPPLSTIIIWLIIAYIVIYTATALVWKWPALRQQKNDYQNQIINTYIHRSASIYRWIYSHQPGIKPVRWVLLLILIAIVIAAMFEWVYPWMSLNIPFLQVVTNYVSVS